MRRCCGGILLLGSLEIFRKVKDRIFRNQHFDSHPSYAERAARIRSRSVLEPQKFATALDFAGSTESILRCVLLELAPMMQSFPYDRFANSLPGDWEIASHS